MKVLIKTKMIKKRQDRNMYICEMTKERIILGIDPGSNIMGFGVIGVKGKVLRHIDLGIIKQSSKVEDHFEKLRYIFSETIAIINQYKPDEFAIEAPFYGNNVQSMLKLGRAQGVAIAAALSKGLVISEYSPRKVKQSVSGSGSSSKEQIARYCAQILNQPPFEQKYLDATDGLAVAICHALQGGQSLGKQKGATGWDAFIKQNPNRIK